VTKDDAEVIVDRLKNGCTYHRFDEPGVWSEYIRYLCRQNYSLMDKAVDKALEDDCRNAPTISQLNRAYETLQKSRQSIEVRNEEYCPVCDDKGFVLMKEQAGERFCVSGKPIEYEYVLYCPFCPLGMSQAYDGSQCKEKSLYKCEPLTKYFDEHSINEFKRKNIEKKEHKDEREGIQQESLNVNIGKEFT
jgi:hypothetical protein